MLVQNKKVFGASNISMWHDAGYRGKGVNIAVLDDKYLPHSHTGVILPIDHHSPIVKGVEFHKPNSCSVIREVCPDASIYGFNWFGDAENTTRWLVENSENIDVVNCSFSSPRGSKKELWDVLEKLDIPFICSSGNDGMDRLNYPSCLEWTISIGAYNFLKGEVPHYSNGGEYVDALCFTYIYIPNSVGRPFPFEGTSAAASAAAGMVGLYIGWRKSAGRPKINIEETRRFIVQNCKSSYDGRLFTLPDIGNI